MDIEFSSKKLQRQLSNENAMRRHYGHVMPALKLRLRVLDQADCLADVPHSRPEGRHQLFHDWDGHFAVWLTANYRLIFKPNHDPVPLLDDGGIDIGSVTSVEIVEIVDYHGK